MPPTVADILTLRFLSIFEVPTLTSAIVYFTWLTWLFLLSHIIPGPIVKGQPLPPPPGSTQPLRLLYTINGFRIFLISLFFYFFLIFYGFLSPTLVSEIYGSLISFVLLFSFFVSVCLYISGHAFGKVEKDITGNIFKDFWLGVELNPKFGGLDLKMFALRPGMMGWIMINISVASTQYFKYGVLSTPMCLYNIFSFLYVADYFFFEERMLSTWDIIAEHWGFMLVFADLWFIPVLFSIQSWYLLDMTETQSPLIITLNLLLFLIGYTIFRISNLQKDQYKNQPHQKIWGQKPKTIGDKLLASGFWGIVQHPNYIGDIFMAISFSLPCGFLFLGAYFYPIYLIVLLVHRQIRDDRKCAKKYGVLWEEYVRKVPYRLIPGVY